jgi:hypothetical protein
MNVENRRILVMPTNLACLLLPCVVAHAPSSPREARREEQPCPAPAFGAQRLFRILGVIPGLRGSTKQSQAVTTCVVTACGPNGPCH